jgi:hypothetical protein
MKEVEGMGTNDAEVREALVDLHTMARGNDYADEQCIDRMFLAVDDALDEVATLRAELARVTAKLADTEMVAQAAEEMRDKAEAERAKVTEERDRLRKALTFYADPFTYSDTDPRYAGRFSRPIAYDTDESMRGNLSAAGQRAREALQTNAETKPSSPEGDRDDD